MINNPKVAFLGMSHLGIVSVISLAAKGVKCVGVDHDKNLIKNLTDKKWPIFEEGIDEIYKSAQAYIEFSADLLSLSDCEIVYISMDVPTDSSANSNLDIIDHLIKLTSQNVESKCKIVILCQVPPGFTRKMRKYHLNIYYQAETLVFGQAFARSVKPERIIIGAENPSVEIDSDLGLVLSKFSCPILLMDYESAEFTKISINAFLAASITTTNELNEIANKIGANWDNVKQALYLDKRIGKYAYLNPGLGISGGNIERDLQTLATSSAMSAKPYNLFSGFLLSSKSQKNWIIKTIQELVSANDSKFSFGILGLAYKENTNSIKNSISLEIINNFASYISGVYDPQVKFLSSAPLIKHFQSASECIDSSNSIVIITPWKEFSMLDFGNISVKDQESFTIIDPYKILKGKLLSEKIKVVSLVNN